MIKPASYKLNDPGFWPKGWEKWNLTVLLQIALYITVCIIFLSLVPNKLFDPEIRQVTYVIGFLGCWRFSWWFTHAVRAMIYSKYVYPRMRAEGNRVLDGGWRPKHLHFMMTTYKEHRSITEGVVRGIVVQIREAGIPATIWLGSGDKFDEDIIEDHLRSVGNDLDITLNIIRQNVGGKRMAIGLVLRAMSRANVPDDDIVVFMDGDFIMESNAVRSCLPLFKLYPDLEAVTTDEDVIAEAPRWMRSMLSMRFAQRRLAMQSHALSGRVLTLTGRMSVFRVKHVKTLEFIRLLEADYLDHWLWGSFRFLSGDDKSTLYYMLKHGARLLYVPDSMGYTVEVVEGNGVNRMVQNYRRWSGNMLRNGARVIALGPRRVPFFIWWCFVDQRIAMWTMLVNPAVAIAAATLYSWAYLIQYFLFLAISRLLLSLVLSSYARTVDMWFPFVLYINQLINAAVKVYSIFRLSKQRWFNRGDQKSAVSGDRLLIMAREGFAGFQTTVAVTALFLIVILMTGLVETPGFRLFGFFTGDLWG
ncbi:MAG: glycosyltransferase family 2 protein [Hyphomicrobiales bacterium]|nr:glycosyltransferase family 2 protein [Hyphomicrobiales bacterium]